MQTNEQVKCKSCHAPLDLKGSGGSVIRCGYCGTDNVLSKAVRQVIAEDTHQFRVLLYQAISAEFSLEDMADVTIRLSGQINPAYRLDWEDIAGSTRTMKAINLVEWCARRSCLQPLVDVVISVRPTIDLR